MRRNSCCACTWCSPLTLLKPNWLYSFDAYLRNGMLVAKLGARFVFLRTECARVLRNQQVLWWLIKVSLTLIIVLVARNLSHSSRAYQFCVAFCEKTFFLGSVRWCDKLILLILKLRKPERSFEFKVFSFHPSKIVYEAFLKRSRSARSYHQKEIFEGKKKKSNKTESWYFELLRS